MPCESCKHASSIKGIADHDLVNYTEDICTHAHTDTHCAHAHLLISLILRIPTLLDIHTIDEIKNWLAHVLQVQE